MALLPLQRTPFMCMICSITCGICIFTSYNHYMDLTLDNATKPAKPLDFAQCSAAIPSFEEAVTEQFNHIMKLQPNFTRYGRPESEVLERWKQSSHNVLIHGGCVWNNMDYLQLRIDERNLGEMSRGGSAFMVRIQHAYLIVCPVTDHFNGIYTIHCPLYGQQCANVSILVKHIDFSGFEGKTVVLEKTLWEKKDICIRKHDSLIYPHVDSKKLQSIDAQLQQFVAGLPAPQSENGHWFRYHGQWRWLGQQGQVLPLEHNTTMCNCFGKFHKTYFLGASHQRINRNCLRFMCMQTSMHEGMNSMQHLDSQKVRHIIPALTKLVSEISQDRNASHIHQIIIQLGSWDLMEHDFQDLIYKWIPKLQSTLLNLLNRHEKLFQQKRIQLLVMSAPSLPDAMRKGKTIGTNVSHRVSRNNWISAVLAFTLRKHVTSLQYVEYLDEFAFTFPLYWYVHSWPQFPNHHYSMWGKFQCKGHVGKAFLGLMASKICPDVVMN